MIYNVISDKPYRVVQSSAYMCSRGIRNGDIVYLARDKGDAAPIFWLNKKMWLDHGLTSYGDATHAIELGLADCIYMGRLEAAVKPNTPYRVRAKDEPDIYDQIVYLAYDDDSNFPAFWAPEVGPKGPVTDEEWHVGNVNGTIPSVRFLNVTDVEEVTEGVLPNTPYMLMEDIAGLKQGDVMYLAYDNHTSAPAFWLPQVGPRAPMTITDWYNDQSFGRNNSITLGLAYLKQMVITDPSMEVEEPEEEPEEPNTDDGDEGEEVDMYYDTDPDPDVNTHYACVAVQPIEVMQSNMTHEQFVGFLRGNIIKYTCRMGRKDDVTKEAAKIKQYATWLEQALRGEKVQVNKH